MVLEGKIAASQDFYQAQVSLAFLGKYSCNLSFFKSFTNRWFGNCEVEVAGVSGSTLDSAMIAIAPKSRVLKEYYPVITALSIYLDALLPSKAQQWVQHGDPESFHRLLATTLVATGTPLEDLPKFPFSPPACSQSEVHVYSSVVNARF